MNIFTSCFPVRTVHVDGMEGVVCRLKQAGSVLSILFVALSAWGQNPASLAATSTSGGLTSRAISNAVAPQPSQPFLGIPQTAVGALDLDDKHIIRAGDKLSFRVLEDGEEAKSLPVTDSGEIELPFNFGRFDAANKTCKSLAQEIKRALERDYYHRASVQISVDSKNMIRGKVYVSGQVTKPGPVTIPTDEPLKLSQAILLAGPPLQWAKLSAVRVVRQRGKQAQTFTINVNDIMKHGNPEKDIVLEPDDWVIVPERGVVFGN